MDLGVWYDDWLRLILIQFDLKDLVTVPGLPQH